MISLSDSGRSSNMSQMSLFLSFSLLTPSSKSSINVSRSIGLIDGPKPAIALVMGGLQDNNMRRLGGVQI